MAIFKVVGLDSSGKNLKSTITAENLAQAKQKSKSQGIMLLSIEEQKGEESLKSNKSIFSIKRVSSSEIAIMTRQLATLVKAHIQIVEALTTLIEQTDNEQLRVVLSDVRQKVNEGSSLANSLKSYPKLFNDVYVNMVEAGETSGNLNIALLKLAEFNENQEKFKRKVQEAMFYPIIMSVVIFAMTIVIFVVMLPKLSGIFQGMGQELPPVTQFCLAASAFLVKYWIVIIISIILIFYLFKKYIGTVSGKSNWHKFLLKVPRLSSLIIMINVERFCSVLATLLESSVPIIASMRIVSNLISNVHMKKAVDDARIVVSEGGSMVGPLVRSGYFPPMVTNTVSLGEKSGEIEGMLRVVAESYEGEVKSSLTKLTTLLGPVMLLAMGAVVGLIVYAVIVPISGLSQLRSR